MKPFQEVSNGLKSRSQPEVLYAPTLTNNTFHSRVDYLRDLDTSLYVCI